jgi:ABC-type glycerol-3-phosphate transport system substrate-binding protein
MFLQSGNGIVKEVEGNFVSTLEDSANSTYSLADALRFYTDFADPLKEVYSWNISLPNSRDYFSSENLGFYFGYASELETLVKRNPNQNFLIAPIPQIKGSNAKATYAKVTGIGILISTQSFENSLSAAMALAGGEFAKTYSSILGIAPARRDLLFQKQPEEVFSPIVNSSALFAKSWLDPSPRDTNNIFRKMIENVISNTSNVTEALVDAQGKMSLLLLQ